MSRVATKITVALMIATVPTDKILFRPRTVWAAIVACLCLRWIAAA